tara:strand:- start:39722 stop:41326 length:1605 start_codon:yes stop_codon:yes gene_type:complete
MNTPFLLATSIAALTALASATHQDSSDAPQRIFQLSDSCERCHDQSENAFALTRDDGSDASPHGTWEGTMMAQSFFDPYWRAKMAREIEAGPESREEIEGLCLRCHAPAAHHHDRLMGEPMRSMAELLEDPAAQDGVNCTVCHRMTADGLGTAATFNGLPPHDLQARIWGPYPDPVPGPMRAHTGYEVTFGEHMVLSSVCATCHTLTTNHAGPDFPEQSPYLEWRNSIYSYEDGVTEDSQSCQQCHMEDQGEMRLAHNPNGGDFPFLTKRPEVRGHRFIGGNTFMLELMADHAEELGILAPPAALRDTADLTRQQLQNKTAKLSIEHASHDGEFLGFEVVAQNLTGHKLPTGYPGRRMWIEVTVSNAEGTFWSSGTVDDKGRIAGLDDAFDVPHRKRIGPLGSPVQVYELVALDKSGEPTALLTHMATRGKDNRLLPRGWKPDGPHHVETSPVGIGDDPNFVGGSDRTHYSLPVVDRGAVVTVRARLLYQSVPPHWVDDLRASKTDEAKAFVRFYDERSALPEVLATAEVLVGD